MSYLGINATQGPGCCKCCYFLIIIITTFVYNIILLLFCGYFFSVMGRYTNGGRSWLISFAARTRDLAIRIFCCIFLSPCVDHRTADIDARVHTSDSHMPRTVHIIIIHSSLLPFTVFLPSSYTRDCRSTIDYNTDIRASAVPRPVVLQ